MKTKLYKMWIDFCRSFGYMTMGLFTRLDEHSNPVYGVVTFNWKFPCIKVKYPSPEYDAWRAFMHAKDPDKIIEWICKNFDLLSSILPATCIFLELHCIGIDDILEIWSTYRKSPDMQKNAFLNEFKKALVADIDCRKHKLMS